MFLDQEETGAGLIGLPPAELQGKLAQTATSLQMDAAGPTGHSDSLAAPSLPSSGQNPMLNLDMIVNVTREYPLDYALIMLGYIMPFVLIITLITNLLVIVVLSQRHMRTPTNIVLMTMAIVDIGTMASPSPWYLYIYTFGNYNKFLYPPPICYAHYLMTDVIPIFLHTSSIWLALLLAGQRYVYVCHPTLARTWCTVPRVKRAIFAILMVAFLHQLSHFFDNTFKSARIKYNSIEYNVCRNEMADWVAQINDYYYYLTYYTFRIFFVFIIPCVLLLTLNILLFKALRRAERKRTELLKSKFRSVIAEPSNSISRKSRTRSKNNLESAREVSSYAAAATAAASALNLSKVSNLSKVEVRKAADNRRPKSSLGLNGTAKEMQVAGEELQELVANQRFHKEVEADDKHQSCLPVYCRSESSAERPVQEASGSETCAIELAQASRGFKPTSNLASPKSCADQMEAADIESGLVRQASSGAAFNGANTDDVDANDDENNNINNEDGASFDELDDGPIDEDEDESTCAECAALELNEQDNSVGLSSCRRCSADICDHGLTEHGHQPLSQCSSNLGAATNTTNDDDPDQYQDRSVGFEFSSTYKFERPSQVAEDEIDFDAERQRKSSTESIGNSRDARSELQCSPSSPRHLTDNVMLIDSLDSRNTGVGTKKRASGSSGSGESSTSRPTCGCLAAKAKALRRTRLGKKCKLNREHKLNSDSDGTAIQDSKFITKASESRVQEVGPMSRPLARAQSSELTKESASGIADRRLTVAESNGVKLQNSMGALLQVAQQGANKRRTSDSNRLFVSRGLRRNKSPSFAGSIGRGSRATLMTTGGATNTTPLIGANPNQTMASSGVSTQSGRSTMDSNRTTLMLIVVVTVFLVVEVPVALVTIMHVVLNSFEVFSNVNLNSTLNYIKLFTNFFIMISYSINFTIYCSMSKKFRETFRDLFCFCKRSKRRHRSTRMIYQTQQQHSQCMTTINVHPNQREQQDFAALTHLRPTEHSLCNNASHVGEYQATGTASASTPATNTTRSTSLTKPINLSANQAAPSSLDALSGCHASPLSSSVSSSSSASPTSCSLGSGTLSLAPLQKAPKLIRNLARPQTPSTMTTTSNGILKDQQLANPMTLLKFDRVNEQSQLNSAKLDTVNRQQACEL